MAKVSKLINFPKNIYEQVENYQKENGITFFTVAVMELIRKGLKA